MDKSNVHAASLLMSAYEQSDIMSSLATLVNSESMLTTSISEREKALSSMLYLSMKYGQNIGADRATTTTRVSALRNVSDGMLTFVTKYMMKVNQVIGSLINRPFNILNFQSGDIAAIPIDGKNLIYLVSDINKKAQDIQMQTTLKVVDLDRKSASGLKISPRIQKQQLVVLSEIKSMIRMKAMVVEIKQPFVDANQIFKKLDTTHTPLSAFLAMDLDQKTVWVNN